MLMDGQTHGCMDGRRTKSDHHSSGELINSPHGMDNLDSSDMAGRIYVGDH